MAETEENWAHVAVEKGHFHLITDLAYARRKLEEIGRGEIVGLKLDAQEVEHAGFWGST